MLMGLTNNNASQQSVHLTCGILRHFQAFFYLRVFFCSRTESTPAHTQVTQTVGHRVIWNSKSKIGLAGGCPCSAFRFGFLVSSSQVWFACSNLFAKSAGCLRLSLVAHLLVVSGCLLWVSQSFSVVGFVALQSYALCGSESFGKVRVPASAGSVRLICKTVAWVVRWCFSQVGLQAVAFG
jgi:hypothetical protein